MNTWLLLTPLIAAVTGWILNSIAIRFMLRSLLQRRRQMAEQVAGLVSEKIFSFEQVEQQITDPANIEKVLPEVEAHIDHFLRVKLSTAMPMISMFIGDKTINQLKEVFMTELRLLFPSLLSNYVQTLKKDTDIQQIITSRIMGLNDVMLQSKLRTLLAPQLRMFRITGAVTGFIIGGIQLLVFVIA
ncbi:DUF445 domain-containing protein [Deminuibacter soli]|uniref:DUF445 family protein n=1 Tax=Deminuibacter soli TaxID=2291815 RepID=A0A3E1NGM2_9BACT|nr:hypothetical protein [Deminuibacter soli]RFM27113.1 hypothetical protein DXN05_16750 [Deminuibacter soli]